MVASSLRTALLFLALPPTRASEAMPEAGDPPSLMVNPPEVCNGSGDCRAHYRPSQQNDGASFGLRAPFWNSRV